MPADTNHSILRSAKHFFLGTFFSRFSGMIRDIAMAFCFGSSPEVAGFMVAYRLAHLFRRVLGEGAFSQSFIPHFEALRTKDKTAAAHFYRDAAYSMVVLLLGIGLGLEALFWGLSKIVTSDWQGILHLAMWMVPGLIFICLYALNSSLLQCEKRYFLPAAAPVIFNATWIGAAIAASYFPEFSMTYLAVGVTVAFFMQWMTTARESKKILLDHVFTDPPKLFSNEWKKILKPLSLGILGVSAMQISSALDAIFAKFADPCGPAYLWYAVRIYQVPIALFGIALSGALLPPLARAIQTKDDETYKNFLQMALRHSAALMVPCMFGIFVLGISGLNLIYGHGDFSSSDVRLTFTCLWAYGLGVIPAVFVLLLAAGFYAQKSYRIPTFACVSAVVLGVSLNALLVFGFQKGAMSIALATSASALVNCLILSSGLKKRIGTVFGKGFWKFFRKVCTCSAIASAFVFLADQQLFADTLPRGFIAQALQFCTLSGIFLGVLALMAWRLRIEELLNLFKRKRPALEKVL